MKVSVIIVLLVLTITKLALKFQSNIDLVM